MAKAVGDTSAGKQGVMCKGVGLKPAEPLLIPGFGSSPYIHFWRRLKSDIALSFGIAPKLLILHLSFSIASKL